MVEHEGNGRWVEIEFDCLPLRSVTRLDVPLDASPVYEQFVLRVKQAIGKHGSHNAYYLHRGKCEFHLTNSQEQGRVAFQFEGTALTDEKDLKTRSIDLSVQLDQETCPWLSEPSVAFLEESVRHAVVVEFNRYIDAGDLATAQARIESIQAQSDQEEGFVGMYL